jgi:hypothetical protein
MDYESTDSRAKGCWDPKTLLSPFYESWCSPTATADFVVDDVWCGMVATLGFGDKGTPEMVQFWTETLKGVYRGDEGRKKLKMALGCLLTRDGLLMRVRDITCPVYWLQVCSLSRVCREGYFAQFANMLCAGNKGRAVWDHGGGGTDQAVYVGEGGDSILC